MTKTSVIDEIVRVRSRLEEIEEERMKLEPTDFAKADLLDEEHELQAQLSELTERAADADKALAAGEASAGTDLTRTPPLPRD